MRFKICGGRLQPVLDTLVYLVKQTQVWTEITTLLIPGKNDSDEELRAMSKWIRQNLGADVPLHFTAFHPDWKMTDIPATPAATLTRAREIAQLAGLNYVYTGNVHDSAGGSTYCPSCEKVVIERDWYRLGTYAVTELSTGVNFRARAGANRQDRSLRDLRQRPPYDTVSYPRTPDMV